MKKKYYVINNFSNGLEIIEIEKRKAKHTDGHIIELDKDLVDDYKVLRKAFIECENQIREKYNLVEFVGHEYEDPCGFGYE